MKIPKAIDRATILTWFVTMVLTWSYLTFARSFWINHSATTVVVPGSWVYFDRGQLAIVEVAAVYPEEGPLLPRLAIVCVSYRLGEDDRWYCVPEKDQPPPTIIPRKIFSLFLGQLGDMDSFVCFWHTAYFDEDPP